MVIMKKNGVYCSQKVAKKIIASGQHEQHPTTDSNEKKNLTHKCLESATDNIQPRTTTHCNLPQPTTTCHNALQLATTHCNLQQRTATNHNPLQLATSIM